MLRPHIVILGAGFGGTYVAKRLAPLVKKGTIDLTIVNRTNYFLFTPLLHEVATGSLSPTSVAEPLREIFAKTGIQLCQGVVESIDTVEQRVHITGVATDSGRHTLLYDYLVVATGAETNYYNIPGAEKFSYPLKNLADAARIRDRVIDAFEEAILCEDPAERMRLLSFAVVGAGPTGVETAAELAEFIHGMTERYYGTTACRPDEKGLCSSQEPQIGIVDGGKDLISMFSPKLREAAAKRLRDHGINFHLGSTVSSVTANALTLANKTTVPASTVIWAAGVKAIIPDFAGGQPELIGGRIKVDEYFRVLGQERVFALGDVAGYIDDREIKGPPIASARPVPMLAQAAVQEAVMLTHNLVASVTGKKLRPFHYRSRGSMVSVGQWFAVGEVFSLKLSGRLAWWMWRTLYLFKFASWKKRFRITFEWTIDLFYPRDITKLS